MRRVLIIHWRPAQAETPAARLARRGYAVRCVAPHGLPALRALLEPQPEVIVIDLDRVPSQGRDIALWLRSRKATRSVPLVFAGGAEAKVAATRALLPDAAYCRWTGIAGAVRRALRSAVAPRPVAPGTMAGYSGASLPKKLGLRPGARVALLGAPPAFVRSLGPLPATVGFRRDARGRVNLALLFCRSRADLARRFPAAARAVVARGALWIVWPKQASGLASDLTQAVVRAFGLAAGWVDYKVAALDPTWSGLCFARRATRRD